MLVFCTDKLPMWLVDAMRCLAYCEFIGHLFFCSILLRMIGTIYICNMQGRIMLPLGPEAWKQLRAPRTYICNIDLILVLF